MGTSSTLSRICAQHPRHITVPTKRIFTQTRSISSTPRLYAEHTDLPSETPSPTTQPTDTPTAYTHHLHHTASSQPSLQHQPPPSYLTTGTITRTATMPQTVQITRQVQTFDKFLKKHYTRPLRLKAHDPHPEGYLREGDVVEYGAYTQAEKDARRAKDQERYNRELERITAQHGVGKETRRFVRTEETRRRMKGAKKRGVQFVVRRVVTPFAVGLDERMERLSVAGVGQEASAAGGQNSLSRGVGGNLSRRSARASVAG